MRKFLFLFVLFCITFIRVSAWMIREDDGYCENDYDRKRGFCTTIDNCTSIRKAVLKYRTKLVKVQEKFSKYLCGIISSNEYKYCCPESEIDFTDKSDQNICGLSVGTRITGGSQTNIFEFPWMAVLLYETAKGLDNLCGGTIITNRYILTAAHCVEALPSRTKLVGVQIGVDNLEWKNECNKVSNIKNCTGIKQIMDVSAVYVHPNYNKKLQNDIALIRVSSEIDFNSANIKPICLPSKHNNPTKTMLVSGWGVNNKGYQSINLLKGEVPIVDNEKCSRFYTQISITKNQICAGGYNETDSCRGDSGGPLMYKGTVESNDDRFIQMGIVSFGPSRCGSGNQPAVYTKVEPYMSWINETIKI